MLLGASGLVLFLLFVYWIWALFDCITTDAEQCRYLPKLLWIVLVVLLFDIGALAWTFLGRPVRAERRTRDRGEGRRWSSPPPEMERPRDSDASVMTDRRSAELDRRLEEWEAEQARTRAGEDEGLEPEGS